MKACGSKSIALPTVKEARGQRRAPDALSPGKRRGIPCKDLIFVLITLFTIRNLWNYKIFLPLPHIRYIFSSCNLKSMDVAMSFINSTAEREHMVYFTILLTLRAKV
jgi:hypothetical protein